MKTMNRHTQMFRNTLAAMAALAGTLLLAPRAGAQNGDKIPVNLSDPSRPAMLKVSLVNGSITVKAHDGKDVVVEARVRNEEHESDSGGPKRIRISTTGLTVEEENNEVRDGTESYARTIDVTVSDPVHTSVKLRAVNDGDIVVTGVDGELRAGYADATAGNGVELFVL